MRAARRGGRGARRGLEHALGGRRRSRLPPVRARGARALSTLPTSAALVSAGGDRVGVVLGLEPAYPDAHACGPALTVRVAPGDNLALHHALAGARAGDVVVVAAGGEQRTAHIGDVLAAAARARGVVGVVVDGAIRDRAALAELRFPVFHRGTSPRGPGKAGPGAIDEPVEIAGTRVEPGDLICADADGIAVVRKADRDRVLAAAAALEAREQELRAAIADGRSTVELLSLPELR